MKQLPDQKINSAIIGNLQAVQREQWNALADKDVPFLRYEFLSALESSGSVRPETGWEPAHYVCQSEGGALLAVSPQYIKTHSYGEYVFDWAWAEAYQRHGLSYYPKLLTAIPFTPCQSQRLLTPKSTSFGASWGERLTRDYQKQCVDLCELRSLSSWHALFPSDQVNFDGMLKRIGVQYHWFNHGYQSFDDFLSSLVSRKRKNIKKERRRFEDDTLRFEWVEGRDIDDERLAIFYHLYQSTYLKRGQPGYLNLQFFEQLRQDMPETMVFLLVSDGARVAAGALFFKGSSTLYGRYWGCHEEYDALHFETCYYRGIEYCIARGMLTFDAGAQGEHKLLRGFEPVETCSYHRILHPDFERAVSEFLAQESEHVKRYVDEARAGLPYKTNKP